MYGVATCSAFPLFVQRKDAPTNVYFQPHEINDSSGFEQHNVWSETLRFILLQLSGGAARTWLRNVHKVSVYDQLQRTQCDPVEDTVLNSQRPQDQINNHQILQVEKSLILENAVLHRVRGRPLVTVMQHNSTIDDPALLASILSRRALQPRYARFSWCADDVCFARGNFMDALARGCKALPARRGAGVNYGGMMRETVARLNSGEWLNVFPEGRVVQGEDDRIAPLRWGVAHAIAAVRHRAPIVIPIVSHGMERVVPLFEPISTWIWPNQLNRVHVRVLVGQPVQLDRVFSEHDRADNPMRASEQHLCEVIMRAIAQDMLSLRIELDRIVKLESEVQYQQKSDKDASGAEKKRNEASSNSRS